MLNRIVDIWTGKQTDTQDRYNNDTKQTLDGRRKKLDKLTKISGTASKDVGQSRRHLDRKTARRTHKHTCTYRQAKVGRLCA